MKFFLACLPPSIILGLLDYRFHNHLWPAFNRVRPGTGFMFDFFSFFDFYLIIFVFFFGISRLRKQIPTFAGMTRSAGTVWRVLIPIVCIVAGIILEAFTFSPVEPQIKSFAFEIFKNYIAPIASFFVLIFALRGKKNREIFIRSLLISFSVLGVFSIFEYLFGVLPGENRDFLGRLAWPYVDPFFKPKAESANWLAYLFGSVALLSLVRLTNKRTPLELIAFAISGLTLALTKSYAGIGLVSLLIFIWLFINVRGKWKTLTVVLFIVFLIFSVTSQIKSRKFQILVGNYKKENSLERRLQIYRFNAAAFKERPIVGLGPGNYQAYFRNNMEAVLGKAFPEEEIPPHPHNLIFQFWSDLGIFGFIAAVLIYISIITKIIRNPLQHGLSFPALYLLGHGLIDVPYGLSEISVIFWILMALDFSEQEGGK